MILRAPNLFLFIFQVIAHIGLIYQLVNGSYTMWAITCIVYFITGCFGMTMTFHRLLSHKSYTSPKWFYYLGTLCGFYGLTGSPLAWVAVHREHHRYTDKEADPHSPLHKSFIRIQWLSMFEQAKVRYVPDMTKDKFQVFLHKNYFYIHVMIAVLLLVIDPMLLVCLYLAPAAILWNAGSFINTLSHKFGYRNHDTKDNSKNSFLLGVFVWGEGWHNNHHAAPASYSFQEQFWEIDIGGWLIKRLDPSVTIPSKEKINEL